jgi:hypothetical protein
MPSLAEKASVDSLEGVFKMMEEAFDEIEDAHSSVPKDPAASVALQSGGRMYPPHPDFKMPNVEPPTYRHRAGHRTVIGKNGSFRILKIEADLSETIVFEKLFEKRGADGKGYWED